MSPIESLYAIVVGIEEYAFTDSDLPGPAVVALTLAEWLLKQGLNEAHLQIFVSPIQATWNNPEYQTLLKSVNRLPRSATHDALYGALTDDLARLEQHESLIIFWAGHGIQDVGGNRRLYYCNSSEKNYLNFDVNSFIKYLTSRAIRCKEQFVVIDACAEFDTQTKLVSLPSGNFPGVAGVEDAEDRHQTVLYSARLGQFSTFRDSQSTFFSLLMEELRKTPVGIWPPGELPEIARKIEQGFEEKLKVYLNNPEGEVGIFSQPTFFFRNWQGNEELSDHKMILKIIREVNKPNAEIKLAAQLYSLTGRFVLVPGLLTCIRAWWETTKDRFLKSPAEVMVYREAWRRGCMVVCQRCAIAVFLILVAVVLLNYFSSKALANSALNELLLPAQQNSFTAVDRHALAPLMARYKAKRRSVACQLKAMLRDAIDDCINRAAEDPLPKDEYESLPLLHKQAHLVLASYVLGDKEPFERCVASNDRSTVRYCLIHWLADVIDDPQDMGAWLSESSQGSDVKSAKLTESLLLALGEYLTRESAVRMRSITIDRQPIEKWLQEITKTHPDPGVHGASDWLLVSMFGPAKHTQVISDISREMNGRVQPPAKWPSDRAWWFVDLAHNTMAVLPPANNIWIGGDDNKVQDRSPRHKRTIDRTFAIGCTEVTIGQYKEFCEDVKNHPEPGLERLTPILRTIPEIGDSFRHPVYNVSWDEAARYCNWLSRRHRLSECYQLKLVKQQLGGGMEVEAKPIAESVVDCVGYRLPTEAEWEYASTGQAGDARFCGNDTTLLERYAWLDQPSKGPAITVQWERPNPNGLFDVYGNLAEWCQDQPVPYPTASPLSPILDRPISTTSVWRCYRGFHFWSKKQQVFTAARFHRQHNAQEREIGFRVARTLLPTSSQ